MKANNIFKLIRGEKKVEDQLSASYAFLLHHNRSLLKAFLSSVGIIFHKMPVIETQRTYSPSKVYEEGIRIDIHINVENDFLLILESKVRDDTAGLSQLKKYADRLNAERGSYPKVRLVLITQTNQKEDFEKNIFPYLGLNNNEAYYFRWNELIELWKRNTSIKSRIFDEMFEKYIGDEMADIKYIRDKLVGELQELLIVPADKDFFPIHMKQKAVWKNMDKRIPSDCQYVAIYRRKPYGKVTHFGQVVRIADWVLAEENYQGSIFEAESKSWGHEKVFYVKEWIELTSPIPFGTNSSKLRGFTYSSITKLLTAKTTDDL